MNASLYGAPQKWKQIIVIPIIYLPFKQHTQKKPLAYGRGHLTYINIFKIRISATNVRLGQISNYLSKNSRILVLKLRRFDERVNETGREFQILGTW